MNLKLFFAIFVTFLVLVAGQTLRMAFSSLEADVSLNQIKTGENAVIERSFIQSNSTPLLVLAQGIIILGVWYPVLKKKNEKTPSP